VNLVEGYVDVNHTLEENDGELRLKPPKTAKSRRRIWIGRAAREALRNMPSRLAMPGRNAHGAMVFRNRFKHQLTSRNVFGLFRRAVQNAGVRPIRFHDLRHTNATLLLATGIGIKTVSERLGHSNVTITLSTYTHVMPGEQKAVSEITGKLFDLDSHSHHTAEQNGTCVQVDRNSETL
jgi:integrase